MSRRGWFEVDRAGLADIAKRRGMAFIVTEPIQNAWDEASQRVEVTLTPVPGSPRVDLVVKDDSPDGFRDLADSYMMFRTSYKLSNPEQRGRFNIGEKLLLSVAERARITSTTGSVIFGEKGRTTGRKRTEAGSVLEARLKMTRAEYEEACEFAKRLIPPQDMITTFNGQELPQRKVVAVGERHLETETVGPEGGFRYVSRTTPVRLYHPLPGEEPHLYEMGIAIDKLDCPWHVEVMQKVPLSIDRASVRTGYVLSIQRGAAEIMAERMDREQSRGAWVGAALEYMTNDEAATAIIKQRFGKAVVFDPSNPESNKRALDAGWAVVHGGELSKQAWSTVRRTGALKPAGQVFETGKVETSPNGVPPVPEAEWTHEMRRVAEYAGEFSAHVLGYPLAVSYYDAPGLGFQAFCGSGGVAINMQSPAGEAVRAVNREKLDQLLIHECAHVNGGGDHLTDKYHTECCRIGAVLRWGFHEHP